MTDDTAGKNCELQEGMNMACRHGSGGAGLRLRRSAVCLALGLAAVAMGGCSLLDLGVDTPAEVAEARCRYQDGEACLEAAGYYMQGLWVEQDPEEAYEYYELACDFGRTDGCWQAGLACREGTGTARDYKAAFTFFLRGCAMKDAHACNLAGELSSVGGHGLRVSLDKSWQLLQRACAMDHATGCFHLGEMLEQGMGVTADPVQAREYYARACRLMPSGSELSAAACSRARP